jgi:two-component system nitrogen regulation sensor histidine kinase NtrY
VKRIGFRSRLLLILALFALVPSIVLTLAWGGTTAKLLPLMSSTAAWDSAAASGTKALEVARRSAHTREEERALAKHEQQLETSVTKARQLGLLIRRLATALFVAGLVGLAALMLGTSRMAGHLSRQLSRPLHELVGWTERIKRGEALPPVDDARGAPEFGVLRTGMRQMAEAVEAGRRSAIEAERLSAFRESARQVAHELKNPLTPIRFAVERLVRSKAAIPAELSDAVEVLATESQRLEAMARSFAQFGRLAEGPPSVVDVGDMVRAAAHSAVPPHITCTVVVAEHVPQLRAQHDALSRAVTNVLLNAVDACGAQASIVVRVERRVPGELTIAVRDTGVGIAPDRLDSIWEPYVTDKTGGTGLGLAIVKQTVLAHGGRVEAESELGAGTEIRLIFPTMARERRDVG